MNFFSQYLIVEQGFAKQFGINNNVCVIAPIYEFQNQVEILLAIGLNKNLIDDKSLFKYRSLKYLNILQPLKYCQTETEHYLIYQNLYSNLLNECKLKSLSEEERYKILLQLVLTFSEFQRRQLYWPLYSINQIYYIEGIIYLSLLEFDLTKFNQPINYLNNFWTFLNQYFCAQFQDMKHLMKEQNFDKILDYLFVKNDKIPKQTMLEPDYENVLKYLLNIKQFVQLYHGNCVVKQFKKNQVFSIYSKLNDDFVYKQTRIYGDEDSQKRILQQIQRDIELMEIFENDANVAASFAYFRIKQFAFLLSVKFLGTLADRFKTWPEQGQSDEQIRKDVYVIASRTAESLRTLHEKRIIHRDLKPQNIFIDNKILSNSISYIADFDCSKQIQDGVNIIQTREESTYTQSYDPPEQQQTFQYDIFQLGLVFLTLANKGKYIGDPYRGPRNLKNNEFDSYYSLDAIQNSLQSTNYNFTLIETIAKCLLRDPKQRPDIETLCKLLSPLKNNSKIQIKQKNAPSDHQSSTGKYIKMATSDFEKNDNPLTQQYPQQNQQLYRTNSIRIIPNQNNNQFDQPQQGTQISYQQYNYNFQHPQPVSNSQQTIRNDNEQQSPNKLLQQSLNGFSTPKIRIITNNQQIL